MSDRPLRIGLVGAGPGWARASHVPALASLRGIALTAVATTRQESALAAAEAFGADLAFDNAAELAVCPDVDLVVVSVKATMHLGCVMVAIEAGKHVFCEWPLGANVGQSRRMAEVAANAGVHNFVGLQAQAAPAVRQARRLVRDGYLGRLYAVPIWGAFPY
jgi:predicted dehydrogenase